MPANNESKKLGKTVATKSTASKSIGLNSGPEINTIVSHTLEKDINIVLKFI